MADDLEVWETFTKGDTSVKLYGTVYDRNGDPLPLTGKTLTIDGMKRGEDIAITPLSCTVTDEAAAEFEAEADDLCAEDGEYRVQVKVAETATPADFFHTDPMKVVVRIAAKDGG